MHAKRLLYVGLGLLAAGIAGLVLVNVIRLTTQYPSDTAVGRGERIFRTGADAQGQRISFSGGMMMGMSCAQCHGIDGRGRRTSMFISPDITYRNLTDPAGMLEPDGERGATYTDDLIKRAVTQGVDADGKTLAWPMPRWRLTDEQWQDLLAYLKTLP